MWSHKDMSVGLSFYRCWWLWTGMQVKSAGQQTSEERHETLKMIQDVHNASCVKVFSIIVYPKMNACSLW